MLLSDLVPRWLEDREEDGLSRCTRHSQGCALRRFVREMEKTDKTTYSLPNFNLSKLRFFLRTLESEGLAPASRSSYINAFRVFGRWLFEKKFLTENPALALPYPKSTGVRNVKTITDAEIITAIEACDRFRNRQRAALTKALLSTLVYTGIRRGECINLRLNDVDLSEASLTIREGKGKRTRVVYVPEEGLTPLKDWITVRGSCDHTYLWALNRRQRVGYEGITTLLQDVAHLAGIPSANLLPHPLRRAAALRMHTAGVPLSSIMEVLGHTSLLVTQKYILNSPQTQRDAARKAVPPALNAKKGGAERDAEQAPPKTPQKPPRPTRGDSPRPQATDGRSAAWRRTARTQTLASGGRFVRQELGTRTDRTARKDRRR